MGALHFKDLILLHLKYSYLASFVGFLLLLSVLFNVFSVDQVLGWFSARCGHCKNLAPVSIHIFALKSRHGCFG